MASASTPVLRCRSETDIAPDLHKGGRTWANTTVCTRSATECSVARLDYLTTHRARGYGLGSSRTAQKRTKRPCRRGRRRFFRRKDYCPRTPMMSSGRLGTEVGSGVVGGSGGIVGSVGAWTVGTAVGTGTGLFALLVGFGVPTGPGGCCERSPGAAGRGAR